MHFTKHRKRVIEPVQHQVRPEHARRSRFEWESRRIGSDQRRLVAAQEGKHPAQPRALPATGLQHRLAKVGTDQLRLGVALMQGSQTGPGTTTQIKHALRLDTHVIEPLQHTAANFALQHGRAIIARRRTRKIAPHLTPINELRWCGHARCRKKRREGLKALPQRRRGAEQTQRKSF